MTEQDITHLILATTMCSVAYVLSLLINRYNPKHERMAVVYYSIQHRNGPDEPSIYHGEPVKYATAVTVVKEGNIDYPRIPHWLEEV